MILHLHFRESPVRLHFLSDYFVFGALKRLVTVLSSVSANLYAPPLGNVPTSPFVSPVVRKFSRNHLTIEGMNDRWKWHWNIRRLTPHPSRVMSFSTERSGSNGFASSGFAPYGFCLNHPELYRDHQNPLPMIRPHRGAHGSVGGLHRASCEIKNIYGIY